MRIGILTFHRALNYGAVLQCYALKETLREMGHDVEVIDYRPECIEKERRTFYSKAFKERNWCEKIKYLCMVPYKYFSKRKASDVFDTFMKNRFAFSHKVTDAVNVPEGYDVIVFGSDQIWSPILCGGFDPVYYGQIKKGKSRFISYAASLEGYKDFLPHEWASVADKMENFDAISVRELSFKEELAKHIQKAVEWVLDPTLLVSPLVLSKIAQCPPYKRYVFLFTVQAGELPYRIARKIAFDKGLIIVRARGASRMNILRKEIGVENVNAVSPEMFIGLIAHAECVVTNSFHATAISLQLRKMFYAVKCQRPNRIIDILNVVGLSNRYFTDVEAVKENDENIDYDAVHSKLRKCAKKSYDYLIKNLRNE